MKKDEYGYVEHRLLEVEGFRVVDATATGPRAHDDLVWVGYGGIEGQWLTPAQALTLAGAITEAAHANLARRGQSEKRAVFAATSLLDLAKASPAFAQAVMSNANNRIVLKDAA